MHRLQLCEIQLSLGELGQQWTQLLNHMDDVAEVQVIVGFNIKSFLEGPLPYNICVIVVIITHSPGTSLELQRRMES